MKNIAIIIRVYDRIEDLELNIQIINSLWKKHNYKIFVVFNGKSAGYVLKDSIFYNVENVITLDKNAGHQKGNSQLLIEGISNIDVSKFEYLIILEADTWLMGDSLIDKYTAKLDNSNAVWASSEWIEKRHSVGVDFAIIDARFIENTYKEIFNFPNAAEMWVAEYMINTNAKYIYIYELMPTHRPSIIKHIYNADGGRIRIFPLAHMVTHHIENLHRGMEQKKLLADIAYKNNYFTTDRKISLNIKYYLYVALQLLLKILPRSSWLKKKRYTFKDKIRC